jgi:hypothetical protein
VELVHQDTVVVLATGVTATTRMLAVLADTTVAGADVAALLAVLRKTRGLQHGQHEHTSVTSSALRLMLVSA